MTKIISSLLVTVLLLFALLSLDDGDLTMLNFITDGEGRFVVIITFVSVLGFTGILDMFKRR